MNISKRDIRRLAQGIRPLMLSGDTPFVVIRQCIKMRFSSEASYQWELIISPDEKDSVPLDRDTALAIIRSNRMEMAFSNRDGRIYELPDRPFHSRYANKQRRIAS